MSRTFKITGILSLLFIFSCSDLEKISQQMETIKGNQEIILAKQKDLDSKLASLQVAVKNVGAASKAAAPKNNQNKKRKTANPNVSHKIDIGNSVVMGNPDAKVVLTKFTDFQWPYCARSVSLVDEILEKYPNDVKVVVKNFPLGSHKQARKAAAYALAAREQGGVEAYKKLYRKIFDSFRDLRNDEDLPLKMAAELGMDVNRMAEDVKSQEISSLIDYEYNQLASLRNAYPETEEYAAGVRIAVPKFFINGREPAGRSVAQWSAMIDEELKKWFLVKFNASKKALFFKAFFF